jgi:hypothetical protein
MRDFIDGKKVLRVRRVTWQPNDDTLIRNATIIGRGVVDVADGGRFHGLVIVPHMPSQRVLQQQTEWLTRHVVVWERSTSRFVAPAVEVLPPMEDP